MIALALIARKRGTEAKRPEKVNERIILDKKQPKERVRKEEEKEMKKTTESDWRG